MREDVPAYLLPGRLRPASGFLFGCRIALKRFSPTFSARAFHMSNTNPQQSLPSLASQPFEAARALHHLRLGRPVILMDDFDRENEADLIVAADKLTVPVMAQLIRDGSGIVACASRRGAGPPGPAAHGAEERKPPRHRLHRVDRGARGREHRRVGGRPRHNHPRRRLAHRPARRHRQPRPRVPAARPARRRADAPRPPKARSTWPCWRACVRPACCAS